MNVDAIVNNIFIFFRNTTFCLAIIFLSICLISYLEEKRSEKHNKPLNKYLDCILFNSLIVSFTLSFLSGAVMSVAVVLKSFFI